MVFDVQLYSRGQAERLSWEIQWEDTMKATKRTKAAGTKSKGMKKGKSLEAVKPLTKIAAAPSTSTPAESVSFNYGKIAWTYSDQK
jgi:hypothetical protein